jgi:hypothetical protein
MAKTKAQTHDHRSLLKTLDKKGDEVYIVTCECGWASAEHPGHHEANAEWVAHYDEQTPASKRYDADLPVEDEPVGGTA